MHDLEKSQTFRIAIMRKTYHPGYQILRGLSGARL